VIELRNELSERSRWYELNDYARPASVPAVAGIPFVWSPYLVTHLFAHPSLGVYLLGLYLDAAEVVVTVVTTG
jgi:hypothetical protein